MLVIQGVVLKLGKLIGILNKGNLRKYSLLLIIYKPLELLLQVAYLVHIVLLIP